MDGYEGYLEVVFEAFSCKFVLPASSIMNQLYPILNVPRDEGDGALLDYKLTAQERELFKEIDSATAALPEDAPSEADHFVAARIGATKDLTRQQSIAFFIRTTFSMFEPD